MDVTGLAHYLPPLLALLGAVSVLAGLVLLWGVAAALIVGGIAAVVTGLLVDVNG